MPSLESLQSLVTNACCFLPCQHQSTTLELTQKGSNSTISRQPLSNNISRLGNRDYPGPGHYVSDESSNKSNFHYYNANKILQSKNLSLKNENRELETKNERCTYHIALKEEILKNLQTTITYYEGVNKSLENEKKEKEKAVKSQKKNNRNNKLTRVFKIVKREVKGAIQHVKPGTK